MYSVALGGPKGHLCFLRDRMHRVTCSIKLALEHWALSREPNSHVQLTLKSLFIPLHRVHAQLCASAKRHVNWTATVLAYAADAAEVVDAVEVVEVVEVAEVVETMDVEVVDVVSVVQVEEQVDERNTDKNYSN